MKIEFTVPDEFTKQEIATLFRMAKQRLKSRSNPNTAVHDTRLSGLIRLILEQIDDKHGHP